MDKKSISTLKATYQKSLASTLTVVLAAYDITPTNINLLVGKTTDVSINAFSNTL